MKLKEELDFLYDNYKTKTSKEISLLLNRSKNSIDVKIIRLGLDISNIWTKEEIEYLEKSYNILDLSIISNKPNSEIKELNIPLLERKWIKIYG